MFVSAGANDPGCYAPTLVSKRRWMSFQEWREDGYSWITTLEQPFGLCEFGHQGLPHEEEIDNGSMIQNRRRVLIARLGRHLQTDPAGYVDGNNTKQYEKSNPIVRLDFLGDISVNKVHGVNSSGEALIQFTTSQTTCQIKMYINGGYGYTVSKTELPKGTYSYLYSQNVLVDDAGFGYGMNRDAFTGSAGYGNGQIRIETDFDGFDVVDYSISQSQVKNTGHTSRFGRIFNVQEEQASGAPLIPLHFSGYVDWSSVKYSVSQSGATNVMLPNVNTLTTTLVNYQSLVNTYGDFSGGAVIYGGGTWSEYRPSQGSIYDPAMRPELHTPRTRYWFDSTTIEVDWKIFFDGSMVFSDRVLNGGHSLKYSLQIP